MCWNFCMTRGWLFAWASTDESAACLPGARTHHERMQNLTCDTRGYAIGHASTNEVCVSTWCSQLCRYDLHNKMSDLGRFQ